MTQQYKKGASWQQNACQQALTRGDIKSHDLRNWQKDSVLIIYKNTYAK